jgi:hypothetical protein
MAFLKTDPQNFHTHNKKMQVSSIHHLALRLFPITFDRIVTRNLSSTSLLSMMNCKQQCVHSVPLYHWHSSSHLLFSCRIAQCCRSWRECPKYFGDNWHWGPCFIIYQDSKHLYMNRMY